MTTARLAIDRRRLSELFDLRSSTNAASGGGYTEDPYPAFHRLRDSGPVHPGTVHALLGYQGEAYFHGLPYPDRPHFSAFSFATCDEVFRDPETFASSPDPVVVDAVSVQSSMLAMNGKQHRRYRALVQPSFVPNKAKWWMDKWITDTVDGLIDGFVDDGQAELNIDFCAAIPLLTITGSFGVSIEDALDLRNSLRMNQPDAIGDFLRILEPIVAARRVQPEDDLISVLTTAELTDEEGVQHRLSDPEIYSFAYLLLAAGSGTTWKQMGITIAALLLHPEVLESLKDDRSLLRPVIEESVRWAPTDPMFSRFVTRDTELAGTQLPAGSVIHLCLGAANRDPDRWEAPDTYDPFRPLRSTLAFGNGPHVCLGMHVARAEMTTAIGALVDRLPNLRRDPAAPAPTLTGLYERGPSELRVLFG